MPSYKDKIADRPTSPAQPEVPPQNPMAQMLASTMRAANSFGQRHPRTGMPASAPPPPLPGMSQPTPSAPVQRPRSVFLDYP